MATRDDQAAVDAALAAFHRAFAAGDPEALTGKFAPDGRLLLLHDGGGREGRAAILEHWTRLFGAWDTGAWHAEPVIVDVHGDRAYTLSTYTETLVSRGTEPSRRVVGRLVLFFQRDPAGAWLVSLALNSHVRPVEVVADGDPIPAMLAEHFTSIGVDEVRAGAAYADDAVLEYVQSGERIAGKAGIIASRQAYPGRPAAFEVVRTTGSGDHWTVELILRFDGADPHLVAAVLDLRNGRIVRERIYLAEPWEAPVYRRKWAEVVAPAE